VDEEESLVKMKIVFPGKRILFCIIAAVFLIGAYFFLQTASELKLNIMRILNQDTLYLQNGNIVRGWIWNEKNKTVIGETQDKEIFIFDSNEYVEIERDGLLHYLRQLI